MKNIAWMEGQKIFLEAIFPHNWKTFFKVSAQNFHLSFYAISLA